MPVWSRIVAITSRKWIGPAVIAILATALVVGMLDPAGDYPHGLEGPGLTLDEIFNAQIGVAIADPLLAGDLPKLIEAGKLLPDHPPLGRLWLGIAHEINLLAHPPAGEHNRVVVACARTGSAIAFGFLVFLIGSVATFWYGRAAGAGAAFSVVLMPRVFGHAHLAALETVLNLAYAGAFLSIAVWWKPDHASTSRPALPRFRTVVLCGVIFGLALLTKIQAIFIPIPVALWALLNWRWRAIWPLALWGLIGLAVLFAGWPWLWSDPVGNIQKYLGHAGVRAVIYVWYEGRQFADKEVPWHYPWVIFLTTVPTGLLLAGFWGLIKRTGAPKNLTLSQKQVSPWWSWLSSREALIAAGISFPLFMFSLPGVAVYDGERLFLIVFPLWAVFIGRGLLAGHEWLVTHTTPRRAGLILTVFLASQSVGLVRLAPCWLSYYNALVGGLSGAERMGFQTTYWGDGVTRDLLLEIAQQIPAGSTIDFLPVQHPFQLQALESQCPLLRDRQLKLRAFDHQTPNPAKFLLVFHRRDYWPEEWNGSPVHYTQRLSVSREGTILAAFYERQ